MSQFFKLIYKKMEEFSLKNQCPNIKRYKIKIDFNDDQKKLVHLDSLKHIEKLVDYLYAKKWIIGVNQTEIPLFTSDSPLVKKSRDDSILGGTGYMSYKAEFAIPLSSKYVLIMSCPTELEHLKNLTYDYCLLTTLRENNVIHYNHLQVAESYNYVFSKTNKFKMIDKYLKASPQSNDPFRKRVTSGRDKFGLV